MDMLELNRAIVTSLDNQNIRTTSFPPSDWATEVGPDFLGDLSAITNCNDNVVPITFGDVVDCKEPKLFGILSGDDLMVRIGNEIPDISHCIFLEIRRDYSSPPNDPTATLIEVWDKSKPSAPRQKSRRHGDFPQITITSAICDLLPFGLLWKRTR